MGSIVRAACNCGFTTDFFCGSERQNFNSICFAPALCPSCGGFHIVDYMDEASLCPHCNHNVLFYNSAALQASPVEKPGRAVAAGDNIFILPRCACLCPRCRHMTMHFTPGCCCE